MGQTQLNELIKNAPCELVTADGRKWIIEGAEFAVCDANTIAVLHKDDDGKRRLHIIGIRLIVSARNLDGVV